MRKPILAVAGSLLFAAVAAAQQKKVDPCTLVTKTDVQQAVGLPTADPALNKTNAASCEFKVGDFGVVGFMVQPRGAANAPDMTMAELKKRKIAVVEANGIGDRSFFASPGYGMTQLNTFKGPHYIILTLLIPGASADKQKAAAEKLMPKALTKL